MRKFAIYSCDLLLTAVPAVFLAGLTQEAFGLAEWMTWLVLIGIAITLSAILIAYHALRIQKSFFESLDDAPSLLAFLTQRK